MNQYIAFDKKIGSTLIVRRIFYGVDQSLDNRNKLKLKLYILIYI